MISLPKSLNNQIIIENNNDSSYISDENLMKKIKNMQSTSVEKIDLLHNEQITSMIWHYNNKILITASNDETIIIRDHQTNTKIATLQGHDQFILGLLIINSGKLLSWSMDEKLKVWNLKDFQCSHTLEGHSHWVTCAIEVTNNFIVSGSNDQNIFFWNLGQNLQILRPFSKIKNPQQRDIFCMLLLGPNELVVSSESIINVYHIQSKRLLRQLIGHEEYINEMKLTANKRLLISNEANKKIRIWKIYNGECLIVFDQINDWVNSILSLSNDIFVTSSREIKFWSINQQKCIYILKVNDRAIWALSFAHPNVIVCCDVNNILKYTF